MILENEPKPLQLQTELYANYGRTACTTAGKYVVDCMDDALCKLLDTVAYLKVQLAMPGTNKADIRAELEETQEEIDEVTLAKKKIQKSRVIVLLVLVDSALNWIYKLALRKLRRG